MKEVKSFVELFIAKITGDDAKAVAIKNQKKATAIFKAEIARREAVLFQFEENVETAQEDVEDALINNGESIADNQSYLNNNVEAELRLEAAKEELKEEKAIIAFLKKKLEFISK